MIEVAAALAVGIGIGWSARWVFGVLAARRFLRSPRGQRFLRRIADPPW